MRPDRVKTKLKRGESVLITCCHFIDPSVYELVSFCAERGQMVGHGQRQSRAYAGAVRSGAKFICHGADLIMVKQDMEQIQQRYAPLGFTFDNRLAAEAARLMENQS